MNHAISMGITNLVLFGLVVAVRRFMHKEGFKSFLIHTDRRGLKLFAEGALLGFALIMLYAWLTQSMGVGKITYNKGHFAETLPICLAYGFGHFAVSLLEEGLMRGYVLQRLLRTLAKPWAIGIPAAVFGLVHLFDYQQASQFPWAGIFNAAMIAVVFSIITIRTESLMFPLGCHMLWNTTQGVILHAPYRQSTTALLSLSIQEGAAAGSTLVPEAGYLISVVVVVLLLYALVRFKKSVVDNRAIVT